MSAPDVPLDDLFRELLDLIAGECGVAHLAAPRDARPALRHTAADDLFPVIGVLAGALADRPPRRRCPGVGGRCGRRTFRISPAGYCPACHRRWLHLGKPERVREYAELTRDLGVPLEAAAERMGICERTAWRYEAALRGDRDVAA